MGLRAVPIDRIVGTMRHPSQNTADFRPLPGLRGRNWEARWLRINRAMNRLETLPPVELVQAGDDYYVVDGHNRVAAARRAGAVDIDADVTQLILPGVTPRARRRSTRAASSGRAGAAGRRRPAVADRRAARRRRRGVASGPAPPGRRAPVTDRLRVRWPDPAPFVERGERPIRILAVSDEPDPSLDSPATRAGLGPIDMVIGAGDLQPEYLSFVADAFGVPLHYVRGNHDVGSAWSHTEPALLPEPMPDATLVDEAGLRIIGFSGSPTYCGRGLEVPAGRHVAQGAAGLAAGRARWPGARRQPRTTSRRERRR